MSAPKDMDTLLRAWMTDAAVFTPAEDVHAAAIQLVRVRRQHPTWLARLRIGPTDVWVAPWARYPVLRTAIQLALIGLLILALGLAAILVGHRGPPPLFGPAANGILVFDAGGRIFARDTEALVSDR